MDKLNWAKNAYALFLVCAATAIALPAQTLRTLLSFDGTDGAIPYAPLVQDADGNFYGTTVNGGANACYIQIGCGTVFKITRWGTLTTLRSFDYTDGAEPRAALVQDSDGNFYGTTVVGGDYGEGTVFKITRSGTLTTLLSFDYTDGEYPYAALVQDRDRDFYGTTVYGGASSNCILGCGTVFKITRSGTLTTLHSFEATDGGVPTAALVQDRDRNFYGTTEFGGASNNCSGGCGTVFKITRSGTLTTLHSFDGTDGASPFAALVQDRDGNFHGTTAVGGASSACSHGCGTVFKITRSGTLTTLHSFDGTDGANPYAGLVQDRDGNFYGTTALGGASDNCPPYSGCGTVFKITQSGTLTTVHSFDGTDGQWPYAALVLDTDGNLYGTTLEGGASSNCVGGCGTVFRLSPIRER